MSSLENKLSNTQNLISKLNDEISQLLQLKKELKRDLRINIDEYKCKDITFLTYYYNLMQIATILVSSSHFF